MQRELIASLLLHLSLPYPSWPHLTLQLCGLQAVAYGLFVTPLYFMWEKAIGTHRKSLWIRLPSRIPVCLFIWFM